MRRLRRRKPGSRDAVEGAVGEIIGGGGADGAGIFALNCPRGEEVAIEREERSGKAARVR
jgi:hypothetical protein